MKRVRKIIKNFTICECQKPLYFFNKNIDIEQVTNLQPNSIIQSSEFEYTKIREKCPICHGTGLRIKKKIFFYPNDR